MSNTRTELPPRPSPEQVQAAIDRAEEVKWCNLGLGWLDDKSCEIIFAELLHVREELRKEREGGGVKTKVGDWVRTVLHPVYSKQGSVLHPARLGYNRYQVTRIVDDEVEVDDGFGGRFRIRSWVRVDTQEGTL